MFFFKLGILFNLRPLRFFHNFNCFLLIMVLAYTMFCFLFLILISYRQNLLLSYKKVEFFSCLIPIFLLYFQIIPSLALLWGKDAFLLGREISVKVIGHQWYWSYELGDHREVVFDSYIKRIDNFVLGDLILLEVDNRLVLPYGVPIRFILTSSDVIHSWALPSFFLKLDCMSGILTVFETVFNLVGVFYGQCSEICGANHSFMPIVVEVTLFDFFKVWLI